MSFGLIQRPGAQLRTFLVTDEGLNVALGNTIRLRNISRLEGWVRLQDENQRVEFYINGVSANGAFEFSRVGRELGFRYLGNTRDFNQSITLQLEITKKWNFSGDSDEKQSVV